MSVTAYFGWGEHPEHGEGMASYTFGSEAELRAFIWGVQEAIGWADYAVAAVPGYRFCGTCDDWFDPEYWGEHADQHGDDEEDEE